MFVLGMGGISLAFAPHWTQRIMIAKSDYALKMSTMVLMTSAWFSFPAVILIGLTAASQFPWDTDHAFGIVTADLMTQNVGYELICLVVLCACLAAFMSTADSTTIGITSVLSIDVVRGTCCPTLRSTYVMYISKVLSLIILMVSAAVATSKDLEDPDAYINLVDWLLAMLWFTVPSYMFGILGDFVKSRALLVGLVVNVIVLAAWSPSYFKEDENLSGQEVNDGALRAVGLGLWPGMANLIFSFLAQVVFNCLSNEDLKSDYHKTRRCCCWDDAVDKSFWADNMDREDGYLKHETLDEILDKGRLNPVKPLWAKVLVLLSFLSASLSLPWYGDTSEFQVSGGISSGIPNWAIGMMVGNLMGFMGLYVVVYMWDAPKETDEMIWGDSDEEKSQEDKKEAGATTSDKDNGGETQKATELELTDGVAVE